MTEKPFHFATPGSSMLLGISWSPGEPAVEISPTLVAVFRKDRKSFMYWGVPHTAAMALLEVFSRGESVGSAFNTLIKHGDYAYEPYQYGEDNERVIRDWGF